MGKLTKKQKMTFIKRKLSTNKKWAIKALIEIYNLQEFNEQLFMGTMNKNKMGFTRFDAELLTSFAEQYNNSKYLSYRQMVIIHKRIPKYWQQILKISDKSILEKLIRNELQAVS